MLLTVLMAVGGLSSAWAGDTSYTITSTESSYVDATSNETKAATHDGSTLENLIAYNVQVRNWKANSNSCNAKFNTGGKLALYKFPLASVKNETGNVKSVTLKITINSTGDGKNVSKLGVFGYNGTQNWTGADMTYNTLSNIGANDVGYTVTYSGSYPILDVNSHDLGGGSNTVLSISALNYFQSAIDDNRDYISFAVANNSTRVTNLNTKATLEVVYTTDSYYSYSVKGVDTDNNELYTISEGSTWSSVQVKVPFSAYYNNNGALLSADRIDDNKKQFNYTFSVTENDMVKTITYKPTSTTSGLVFLSEAEDINGMTAFTTGNTSIRASRSSAAYAPNDVTITTLNPGKYKITSGVCDSRGSSATASFTFKAGESTIFTHTASTINWDVKTSDEFTITEPTDIILAKGGQDRQGVDFIYIVQTASANETSFTVKFVDEQENTLKADVVTTVDIGTSITASAEQMASFFTNDKKYIYKSGNTERLATANDEENIITLVFREAETWSYTVTSNLGIQIVSSSYFEGETITQPYPRYQLKEGTLYEKSATNKEYRTSFVLDENNKIVTLTGYNASSITNAVFYTEAEHILGATSNTTATNVAIRASNAAVGAISEPTTITTLEPGIYKLLVGNFVTSNNKTVTSSFTINDQTIEVACTGTNLQSGNSDEFTVKRMGDFVWSSTTGNGYMDYIIIQKTGEYVPPTIDITDLYLTNPSFETGDLTGWTVGESSDTGARSTTNDTYKMTNSEGNYLFNTWWQGIPITQTIQSLPAGTYTLSSVVASDGATVYMISGDDSNEYVYTETTNAGVGIPLKKTFTLTEAADFKIGAVGGADGTAGEHKEYVAGGYWWYKADAFKLKLILEDDATIPAAIVAKLEAANPVNQGTVGSVVAAAYTQAKSTFESNATLANYEAYLAAVATYNMSVAQYAAINSESGALPIESTDGWAISTKNGTLARNTWSTEGNSDGSGMTTPFIQDWVGSGTPLAGGEDGGKLYYRLLLTPGETYAVTALVRAFNEAGTGVTGATYYVGDDEKSIDELGSACTGNYSEKGKFGTFSCIGTVGEDGVLEFGVKLASNSPINWLSIKDIVIKESSGIVPTAIELSQTSAALTTGDVLTITATITPNDAEDQTVLWTSSNEAVATVSGGVISAIAAGTATITAKAVAGNNVTATATITVADAPAPSFYSSEIADATDYYIVNAATGTFLGGANSWGTQASLIEHGIPFTTALKDGKYTLDSHTYNSATDHFFNGTYIDGSATNLYITSLGNGKFSISTAEGSNFVSAWAGNSYLTNTATIATSSLAQWYFLAKSDRDKMLAAATSENPADATYYIKEANISRNLAANGKDNHAWSNLSTGGDQDNSNFVAQVYNASVNVEQTIDNIPNGTYTLTMQGFTSGSDVKLYANDIEVAVRNNDSGANSCKTAAPLFAAKSYPNTLTVTVTDHTLKIGLKGDCTSSKWLVYDNFELYLTSYTPVTAINATIDKNEIYTLKEPATITASVTPATASFTGITYTSSNESVATVSADGVVTGVAAGQATITVKAEVDNVETTIAVTVIESVLATADDYAALNAAINSHVMGFLEGEYAPYNNAAESFATVTAAKAIDQTVDNLQSTVQAATQAITNATWVVNTEEVNAFYDGTFAAATNNGAPNGWRMSNNTLGGDYHSRAFVGDDRLVEFNDTKSGLFLRFDNTNSSRGSMYYYGDTEGYTMPLKANTYYRVTVDFAGWGSTGKPLRMNVTGPEGFSAVNQQYNTSVRADNANNTPQQFNIVFQTAGEGNYVINFQTPGADTNTHNVVISNLKLFTEPESSATLAVTAAKYGTFIAPFDVTLPEGVTAYTVTDGDQLTMTEVTNNTIPANTPVVVSSEEVVSETVKGYSLAIKDSYTMEALTGTYVDIDAPNGSYILQNQNGKVGFYKVDTSVAQPKVRANRAYLSSGSNARSSFLFEDSETVTAINAVKALTEGEALIYDMNGMQQPRLKKGMNIIRTKDGRTQKVMVR